MNTILKRIGKNITNPKMEEGDDMLFRYDPNAPATQQAEQKLRKNLTDFRATKTKAATGDQTRNAMTYPISDITGSRGLVSQKRFLDDDNNSDQGTSRAKDPYIPISVVTGSRDITTVSPQLRTYLLQGSPSATTAIPKKHADLANVLEKAGDVIQFDEWSDMSAKQQLATAQRAGLSQDDLRVLLNSSPHYVETIAKVQDLFANRNELGITLADAQNAAKELFDIANERNEAITRTGRFENDVVFAPRVLRWLDEKEKKLLEGLGKDTGETIQPTWYNGGNPDAVERVLRRASYADIDETAATKQIEALIMKNVEDAKKIAALSGQVVSKLPSSATLMQWFYNNVKKDAPMDYKNPAIWSKILPGLPYPEEDKVYNVFGYDISSSDLGNLNYSMIGKALGIPEYLLLQQAGAAELRDHGDWNFPRSQIESIREENRDFGDQPDDQIMIKIGFNLYNLL